jgi:copper chaperone CopZ
MPIDNRPHADAACELALEARSNAMNAIPRPRSSLRGALVAAACWWLPLVLVLIALTFEGMVSAPGRLRLSVALAAGAMLVAGFVLVYTRRRTADGPARGLWRLDAVMTWVVAASVGVYALSARGDRPPTVRPPKPAEAVREMPGATKIALSVEGMTCQGCVETVTEALLRVPGVVGAVVRLDSASAVVSVAPGQSPGDSALVNAVALAGYRAWPFARGAGANTGRPAGRALDSTRTGGDSPRRERGLEHPSKPEGR